MFKYDSTGGYNVEQVDKFVADLQRQHNQVELEQQERILALKKQLTISHNELSKYKQNNDQVANTVFNAVNKAQEVEQLSLAKYQMELQQLRAFHTKWLEYYDKIIMLYPLDDALQKIAEFNTKMNSMLNIKNAKQTEDIGVSSLLHNLKAQQKKDDMTAQSKQPVKESKFDYKEALNPKDKLIDIIKELGLGNQQK